MRWPHRSARRGAGLGGVGSPSGDHPRRPTVRGAQVPCHARTLTSSAWGTISKPPIGEWPPESPVSRLRANRAPIGMRQFGLGCMHYCSPCPSQTKGISRNGPETGHPTPCWQSNHPSPLAHANFVSGKVEEGVRWDKTQQCPSTPLHCIRPLEVAVNAVGQRRLT